MDVAQLVVRISADTSSLSSGMAEARAQIDAFASVTVTSMGKAVDDTTRSMGEKLRGVGMAASEIGRGLTMFGGAVVGALALGVKAGSDLEQKLLDVKTNAGLSSQEFELMKKRIGEMGQQTPAPLEKLAQGFMRAHDIGFSFADSMKIVNAGQKVAVATGADHLRVIDQLATTMHIYKMRVEDANKVGEEQVRVMNRGKMTMEQFSKFSGQAHAVGQVKGLGLTDVDSALATMTQHGLDPAIAQTQFKGMVDKISRPTDKVKRMLAAMDRATGMNVSADFTGTGLKTKGLDGVITDVIEMAKRAQVDPAQLAMALVPQQRGGIGFAKLVQNFGDKKSIEKTGDDALAGKSHQALDDFSDRTKTLGGQMGILHNNLLLLAADLNKTLAPAFKPVIDAITNAVQWFLKLPDPVKQNITMFVGIAGVVALAAGTVLTFVGHLAFLAAGLSAAGVTWAGVSAAASAFGAVLTGPVGIAIALAVAAVVGLGLAWKNNWFGIRDSTQQVVGFLAPYLATAWNGIKTVALQAWGGIKSFLMEIWPPVKALAEAYWNGTVAFYSGVFNVLKVLFAGTWDNIVGIIRGAWDVLAGLVKIAWGLVAGIIVTGLKLLTGDWKGAWDAIQKYAGVVWDGIKQLVGGAITEVANLIAGGGKILWNAGSALLGGLVNGIKAGVGKVGEAAKHLGQTIVDGVKSTLAIQSPSKVMQGVGLDTAHGLVQGLIDGTAVAKKGGVELADAAHDGAAGQLKRHEAEIRRIAKEYAGFVAGTKAEIAANLKGEDGSEARQATRFRELGQATVESAKALLQQRDASRDAKKEQSEFSDSLQKTYAHIRDLRVEIAKLQGVANGNTALQNLQIEKPHIAVPRLETKLGADATAAKMEDQRDALKAFNAAVEETKAKIAALQSGSDIPALANGFHRMIAPADLQRLSSMNALLKDLQTGAKADAQAAQLVFDLRQKIANAEDKAKVAAQPKDVRTAINSLGDLGGEGSLQVWRLLTKARQDDVLALVRHAEAQRADMDAQDRARKSIAELREYITTEQAAVAATMKGDRGESGFEHFLSTHQQFRDALLLDKKAAAELQPVLEKLFTDKSAATDLDRLRKLLQDADLAFLKATKSTDQYAAVLDKAHIDVRALAPEEKALADAILQKWKATEQAKASTKEANKEDREADQITRRLREGLADAQAGMRKAGKDTDYYQAAIARLNLATRALTPAQKQMVEQIARLDQLKEVFTKLADGMKGVFSEAFSSLDKGFKGFMSGIVTGFQKMLLKLAADLLASELTKLLTGLLGSFLGGGVGGTGLQAGDSGGGLFGLKFAAAGGFASMGQPFVVGERGPELFLPRTSGNIVPNHELGGGSVHVHMNISTPDANSFRYSHSQIMERAHAAAEAARRRNG